MTAKRPFGLVNLFVVIAKVLLVSVALLYLAYYFDLPLFAKLGVTSCDALGDSLPEFRIPQNLSSASLGAHLL